MHRNLLSLFDLVLLHVISNRSAFVEDFKFPEQDDKEIASEQAFVGGADGIELKSPGCKLLKWNMEPEHETLEEEKHFFFLIYRF